MKNIKKIHFTGIKGVGMAALAICAKDLGIEVSGSDIEERFVTDETLKKAGISWKKDLSAKHVLKDIDLLITTGAHGGLKNVEVLEAKKRGIKVMTQGEAVALFAEDKKMISVCGVGGKTSVSSMIATVLDSAGVKPSYAIGVGEIFPLGLPGAMNKEGEHFVTEADEFVVSPGIDNTPKFLLLDPFITVVTNIEHDHPDVYPTFEDVEEAYLKFFEKIPTEGVLVVNADNENSMRIAKSSGKKMITYGTSSEADWKIDVPGGSVFSTKFMISNSGERVEINLNVPGGYNVSNATATYIVARNLGVSSKEVVAGLKKYEGSKRRFEKVGTTEGGVTVIDDYAHHPGEIKQVLKLTRRIYPEKRVISLFQPHTYSRTKSLFTDFANSFGDVDIAGFVKIYPSAREKKDLSVSSKKLAEAAKGVYTGDLKETVEWVKENTKEGDILLTLGAGDIFHIHDKLIEKSS